MSYIVVAYYTENSGYAEEMKNLEASLNTHHLPRDIVAITDQGNWQKNTHYKPYFIKQMLIKHFPKDILYLDADARVQQYPTLFDSFKADMGIFYWERNRDELISSTLYFANNAKAMEIVERWITCCFENPALWDQKVLDYVIKNSNDLELNVQKLPPTYCQIFDLMRHEGQPVIEQFQASRRFKGVARSE